MPNRSSQGTQNPGPVKSNQPTFRSKQQYGIDNDSHCLLSIPPETLTGITSYLDPFSLLSLSRVNKRLFEHVKDDNTWHRAFANQFLGIGPEGDLGDTKQRVLLRRLEPTWKREFIFRYRMTRRWALSRSTTITHVPVYSPISSMHIMGANSLLSSSLQYGIVARSRPLTGRILRGYLDASGTGNGLGIGNPNAEFNPDVTACAPTSDGGTARIVWGYRNGQVAILTAPKAMEASTSSAELILCRPDDQHVGTVLDAAWDTGKSLVVTAGADGTVKLWNSKAVRCLWTSDQLTESMVPDPCVMAVAALTTTGSVAAATRSGKVLLWTGFQLDSSQDDLAPHSITQFHHNRPSPPNDPNILLSHDVVALHVDPTVVIPTILVAYRDDPLFHRLVLAADRNTFLSMAFGDPSFGPTSSIVPFFRTGTDEASFVLAGDHLGCLSVYDWNADYPAPGSAHPIQATTHVSSVLPIHKFEAHEDGSSITSIAWNGVALLTGSARGYTQAWDGLTLEHLKTFSVPTPPFRRRQQPGHEERHAAVNHILLGEEKDLALINVGDAVMAWLAGPVPRGGLSGRHRIGFGLGKKKAKGTSKYYEQLELKQTIAESKEVLKEESDRLKKVYGREREHLAGLERLGLDEAGAIEYAMMLSLEEAGERQRTQAAANALDDDYNFADGVTPEGHSAELFEDDLDDLYYGGSSMGQTNQTFPLSPQSETSSLEEHPTGSYTSTPATRSRAASVSPIDRLSPLLEQISAVDSDVNYVTPSRSAVDFPPISSPTSIAPPSKVAHQGKKSGSSSGSRSPPKIVASSKTSATPTRSQALFMPGQSDKLPSSPSPKATPGLSPTSVWARSPQSSVMSASASVGSNGSPSTSPTAWAGGNRSGRLNASPGGAVYHHSPRASARASRASTPSRGGVSTYGADDDLRFAIELSLAEARSRGENV